MSTPSSNLESVQERVERQPFTRLLQAKLIAVGPDSCELKVSVQPNFCNSTASCTAV